VIFRKDRGIVMKLPRRRFLQLAAGAAALPAASHFAWAQTYPSRPVHILVPYPAGGGVDIVARSLGDELSKHWGQPVVIENRPGAGGVIASQAVAISPKDGYMLIVVASGHATNPFLYAHLPYDTFKDFAPISLLGSSPNILLVRADSPFKTLADLIAEAKKKPGSLSYGHAGNGTSTHLAGELLKRFDRGSAVYRHFPESKIREKNFSPHAAMSSERVGRNQSSVGAASPSE
jgi:tripartite-type tricarboxylate transporter receptor subunit TctC